MQFVLGWAIGSRAKLHRSQDKLPDGWGAERFKIVEGGDARVGIKGTSQNQRLNWTFLRKMPENRNKIREFSGGFRKYVPPNHPF